MKIFTILVGIIFFGICFAVIVAIFIALDKLEKINPFKFKPYESKPKKTKVDTTYRDNKEKEMYKRLARQDEKEARMENEIRGRLKNK